MIADIEYRFDGDFARIYPKTSGGQYVFGIVAMQCPRGVIDACHWPSVRKQIKDAGYTVRKARNRRDVNTDGLAVALKDFVL